VQQKLCSIFICLNHLGVRTDDRRAKRLGVRRNGDVDRGVQLARLAVHAPAVAAGRQQRVHDVARFAHPRHHETLGSRRLAHLWRSDVRGLSGCLDG
jgi:hypothetical protein